MTECVVLIGDSIRMGYQETVREELAGLAEVWAPEENGLDSRNVLAHLERWALSRDPAVVHLNCGLHDLKRNPNTGAFQVPIAEYQANVGMILDRVLRTTKATVIWATITPVNEVWHRRAKDFDRFEGDVRAYNAATLEAVTGRGVALDDLYTLVSGAGRDGYLSDDGVHFTDEGYTFLGRAVAGAIRCSLSG